MAIFGSKEQEAVKTVAQESAATGPAFLGAFGGIGTEGLREGELPRSYFKIIADLSQEYKDGQAKLGDFFNTGTGRSYGPEVRVVPVASTALWEERDSQTNLVVDRWPVEGVETKKVPNPKDPKARSQTINANTGNRIVETYAMILVLPDDPEAGPTLWTVGQGSLKAFQKWRMRMMNMRIPGTESPEHPYGRDAPIFSKVWRLKTGDMISKQTNKSYKGLIDVLDEGWVDERLCEQRLLPGHKKSTQLLPLSLEYNPAEE